MAPTVFLKASSVPKIWNDGVRSQRHRLADLFGAAAEQALVAAYCLGVEHPVLIGTSELDLPAKRNLETLTVLSYRPAHECADEHYKTHDETLSDWLRTVLKIRCSNEKFYRLYHQALEDMAALRLPIFGTDHIASSFACNSEPEQKTASRKFVPAKYEIVNLISAFDSGPLIQSRRLRNSK